MIGWILAPIFLFLVGFLFGYAMSTVVVGLGAKIFVAAVLWLPFAAVLLLQYTEVIAPDTFSLFLAFLLRVIEYPMLGFLVGCSLETVLATPRLR